MKVQDRFLQYVSFDTQSDDDSMSKPSTEKQLKLADFILKELKNLGLENVRTNGHGYVYADLPANVEGLPVIGLIAHMDTSPDAPGKDIKPSIIRYEGGNIELSSGAVIDTDHYGFLSKYIGNDLIVTDGTTLLGADDKAGIAEIITAVEYLINHPEISHGKIAVGFTPDEEVGRGADDFDIPGFGAEFAYTVDGGALGEIEYENFNAAGAMVTFNGFSIHPGDAKGRMKNAILMANDYINLFPENETPATTEGYEGFYHMGEISGSVSSANIKMIIRDHDRAKFEAKKEFVTDAVAKINEKYGDGSAELIMRDSYYNMREKIEPVMFIVDRAKQAMKDAGVEPVIKAIRGGTDGARLSFEGLPCPNLSTGGENYHGPMEFVSVQSMEKMVQVIVNIAAAR